MEKITLCIASNSLHDGLGGVGLDVQDQMVAVFGGRLSLVAHRAEELALPSQLEVVGDEVRQRSQSEAPDLAKLLRLLLNAIEQVDVEFVGVLK